MFMEAARLKTESVRGTVGVLRPAEGGHTESDAIIDEIYEV